MSKMKKIEIGQYIHELRKQKEETLHEVSKGTDIDSPMLSKIERGGRLPTLEQLKRISKYFKVSEDNLKIMLTAKKILREYGANHTTYQAVRMVEEEIITYVKKKN